MVFQNSAGSGAGSWASISAAGSLGGSHRKSTTIGDKVTISWTGRALYLYIVQDSGGADFTITTDGVTKQFKETCNERDSVHRQKGFYRVPICLERDLFDGPHITVIQSVATTIQSTPTAPAFNLYVEGHVSISGIRTKPASNTRIINTTGDSWTVGVGATTLSNSYVSLLVRELSRASKQEWTLNNKAASGAAIVNTDTNNIITIFEQIVSSNANAPNSLTIQSGVNSLRSFGNGESAGQFIGYLRTALMLVEDIFDTSEMKVVVGTPGFISSHFRMVKMTYFNTILTTASYSQGEYELAVRLVRGLKNQFPWLRIADVYAAMNEDPKLVYPNNDPFDLGLHLNNSGHGVVASPYIESLMS
ncbi:SGNH/GDSL hydrolase family protein [Dyadobacter chenwenxiniae]|uniref:SGNH/GDSL hydrolase family protein n=1 Tax=Dyadobacter chenwenxiniae TaxID=2906456 RepID=A0A9X1TCQ8_9BACT|nr:SGNH/GDSL hydrolase family protein [Dyadobacter chenwenxiniae]MCF0059964.1 SGNH/GDSL hydrolase family protein [Dyadobacter chenwenxiniae]UON85703.1 SGNH/GDSL hydrolase family protein [Dyadobacter chenwenxiniae]